MHKIIFHRSGIFFNILKFLFKQNVNLAIISIVISCSFLFNSCIKSTHPVENTSEIKELLSLDTLLDNSFESLAKAYESSDRLAWQKPNEVINFLGNLSEKVVADIGAGTGYFSFKLAQDAQKVIAIDIDTMALVFIDSSMQYLEPEVQSKVETRLAFPNDPRIRKNEVDVVLMVNTYTFIGNRIEYFRDLYEQLKPNAEILVINFKKKKLPIGPPSSIKVPLNVVEYELEHSGFKLLKSDDRLLDYQYLVHAIKQ